MVASNLPYDRVLLRTFVKGKRNTFLVKAHSQSQASDAGSCSNVSKASSFHTKNMLTNDGDMEIFNGLANHYVFRGKLWFWHHVVWLMQDYIVHRLSTISHRRGHAATRLRGKIGYIPLHICRGRRGVDGSTCKARISILTNPSGAG